MGRFLAIDYGRKRSGIAVTDILQICANGLPTVKTSELLSFLKEYCSKETVEEFIVGEPKNLDGSPSDNMKHVVPFVKILKKTFPNIPVTMVDERFTSTIAHQEMVTAGFKKKTRQEKGKADEIAAVLILNSYLESKKSSII